jgi:hypothetical protein
MANLNAALSQLREQKKRTQGEIDRLDQAIRVLESLGKGNGRSGMGLMRARPRISAAGRRRIALAQKARWAKVRALREKKAA